MHFYYNFQVIFSFHQVQVSFELFKKHLEKFIKTWQVSEFREGVFYTVVSWQNNPELRGCR